MKYTVKRMKRQKATDLEEIFCKRYLDKEFVNQNYKKNSYISVIRKTNTLTKEWATKTPEKINRC